MHYLHYEFDVGENDVIEVILDKQANVRLMDDENYAKYVEGQVHSYYGGYAEYSPLKLRVPRAGHWHVVVDLGGYGGTVRATAHVLQGAA